MSFQPIPTPPSVNAWNNDHLQFARLLAEIHSSDILEMHGVLETLTEATDLSQSEVLDLIERARESFDDYQQRISQPTDLLL